MRQLRRDDHMPKVLCARLLVGGVLGLLLAAAHPAAGRAQETTLQEVSRQHRNPFADSVKLSFELDTAFRIGPKDATGENLNVQAVIPFSLTSDWLLITRSTLP